MKYTAILVLTYLTLIAYPSYSQIDSERGLLLYHPFTNGSLINESGNNRNCELNGATLTMDAQGNPNQAYEFDGELVASSDHFSNEIANTDAPIEIDSVLYTNRFLKGKIDEIRKQDN